MNNIAADVQKRVQWIKELLVETGASGIVLGASGGKDSVLVSILCRMATPKVTGIIMPCGSSTNYGSDRDHALLIAENFDINTIEVDLTKTKEVLSGELADMTDSQNAMAFANINPRLRMITLYNYAQRMNYLVAGTGNRSEITMGYFTKWGDGGCDFNPISDLTVSEIYQMLGYLQSPDIIITKAPSAGLFEGQTDEADMGITYKEIDNYLLHDVATAEVRDKIETAIVRTSHKRLGVRHYK